LHVVAAGTVARVKGKGPVVLVAILVALGLEATPAKALSCGGFRWPVKTLSDTAASLVDYLPRTVTVKRLRSLDPPSNLESDTPRIHPVEFHTYKVKAELIGASLMADHDYHVVISAPTDRYKRMIVELPDVRCPGARRSYKRHALRRARARFTRACGSIGKRFVNLNGSVTLVGVGFWDDRHPGRNSAPNGIVLHPVLKFWGSCQRA
jgi:hypothetical protein